MKKFLLIIFIWFTCLPGITAKLVYENVEIDGFTYNLYQEARFYDGDTEHSIGYVRGLSDQRYAEFCESHHLSLPSTIEYDGEEYIVTIGWDFFERRDFKDMEVITFGGYTLEYLNDFPNLKRIIMEGECIYGYYSNMRNLPSLQELELSITPWDERWQQITFPRIESCFINLGIESLRFSKESVLAGVTYCFRELPNITELTLCYIHYCTYCFLDMPKLQELTFEIAPNWSGVSFNDVPMLKKIVLKKWNDDAVVRFYRSFMKAPLLKDIYVEEAVPCYAEFYSERDYVDADYEEGVFYPPHVTLHVPVGSRELYAAADGWKDFGEIVEYDPAEIEATEADASGNLWSCTPTAGGVTVSADSDVAVDVMSPSGAVVRRVVVSAGDAVMVELPAGIYIVAGGGQSAKVCVR